MGSTLAFLRKDEETGSFPSAVMGVTSETARSLADAGREAHLLLRLTSLALTRPAVALARHIDGDIDWRKLGALAHRHRVVPLIWHYLSQQSEVVLPARIAEDFQSIYRQNALHGLRVTSHLTRIIGALAGEGIAALPLKGVCLAARYYGNVAARFAGDIDLLVPLRHIARADTLLHNLGYLRVSNKTRTIVVEPFDEDTNFRLHYIYISRDGVPVELHFQLHNNPDVLPIDAAEIVAQTASVTVARTTLPVMPDDLQLVFLATHGARHEWVRLQWVCDIAVMVDRARPEDVRQWLATAARYSLTNPVVQAMVLAERLLGSAIPPEVAHAFARSGRIRYMVRRAERTMLRVEERKQDRPATTFDPGRRLYRMCMTARPLYLWHEIRNGMLALATRVTGRARSGRQL